MGFFKPSAFISGVAKGGLDFFDKAEKVSEDGLENLKVARDEVTEEISTMKGNYDKAIQIGDTVGGGAFAKYLFNTQDINYLANLSEQTQESRIGELSTLKKIYENLPDTEKARYEEGEFGDVVKEQYNREVDELKVKNGLVNTNNMGDATANTLAGKIQTMVDRGFQPRRDAIISSVGPGNLRESTPVEGGFEALPTATTGVIDFSTGGGGNMEVSRLKATILGRFEEYLESNRFKAPGTTLFTNAEAKAEFGNVVGIDYDRTYQEGDYAGMKGSEIIDSKLEDMVEELENLDKPVYVTKDAIMMDILKQNFINKNFGDVFNYVGLLDSTVAFEPEDE